MGAEGYIAKVGAARVETQWGTGATKAWGGMSWLERDLTPDPSAVTTLPQIGFNFFLTDKELTCTIH